MSRHDVVGMSYFCFLIGWPTLEVKMMLCSEDQRDLMLSYARPVNHSLSAGHVIQAIAIAEGEADDSLASAVCIGHRANMVRSLSQRHLRLWDVI